MVWRFFSSALRKLVRVDRTDGKKLRATWKEDKSLELRSAILQKKKYLSVIGWRFGSFTYDEVARGRETAEREQRAD